VLRGIRWFSSQEKARSRRNPGGFAFVVLPRLIEVLTCRLLRMWWNQAQRLSLTDCLSITRLGTEGYEHLPHIVTTGGEEARQQLKHVHLVISLLKRWLKATHQGVATPSHLQTYRDEFSFRFNRRHSRYRGNLFCRLMQKAELPALQE
jgi:hypothetical protein